MKYLLAIVLLCATFAPYVLPWPPVHIEPHVKPIMLGGELWPSYLPTPTVTP